ncbi:MAG: ferric reductase-like transmembrane domain-containing protein [Planctomycetes bacterium]|nr:ferric reductase-like transmembrane domain-containing protein [Planctomycetota bacterium]
MQVDRFTKWVVIVNCAVPVGLLTWDAINGRLGANPVNFAIRTTGILSLIFLILSLAVTPLMRLAHWSALGQFRRVMGLYAFFHAAVHFGLFYLLDRKASVADTFAEIATRRYLLVGIVGLIIMVPLAITSTNRMIQRLGPKRWKWLHRLAYLAAIAGALHYYMLVKADTTWPLIFAAVLGVLLGYRLVAHYRQLRADSYALRHAPVPSSPEGNRPQRWEGNLRVAAVFVETPEVRTFRLVPTKGTTLPFAHLPGQFLTLRLNIDGREVRRSYTIASPPSRSAYCELSIKREENGLASRHVHDTLQAGELVNISASAGRFTFTGLEAEEIVMLAGGVGITPLMSQIRYLTDIGWPGQMQLIYSVKTEADIIFRQELDELQRRYPNLRVIVTLTRDTSPGWTGLRGRITGDLLIQCVPHLAKCRVHLCGPNEMVGPLKQVLQTLGIPLQQIHSESFGSPSRQLSNAPAAPGSVANGSDNSETVPAFRLRFAKSNREIAAVDGKTILDLAESHGIAIPYDCRAGVCGQCKTRLISGSVEMDSEDAIEARERAQGLILACQARCLEDVVVEA